MFGQLDKNKGGQQSVYADITKIAKDVGWKYHSTIIWNEGNISKRTAERSSFRSIFGKRHDVMKIIIKQFNKPTHWSENKAWINLRQEFVEQAKKNKAFIVIKLPQGYCKPVDPEKLLKYGKKTEAVFLYPDSPMKLIGAYFELYPQETQEWIESDPYFWDNL